MKVFVSSDENFKYTYPEEMAKIIKYIEDRGTLNVKYPTLEKLWYAFSETRCAAFLIADDATIDEFLDWIHDLEVEDALKMDYYGDICEEPYRNADGIYL